MEHLKQNVKALEISLSAEQIQRIEGAKPIDLGFPYNYIVSTSVQLPITIPEFVNRDIAQKLRFLATY